MEVRAMEEAISGEAAMPPEKMSAATSLVNRKTSMKEVAKTLTKTSVEDWQRMITPNPAFFLKDDERE